MATSPLYIQLPGMEVYLAESLLHRRISKASPIHTHAVYELVCVQMETEMVFRITPPFWEHVATDASMGNVTSMLFSFTQPHTDDICQTLQSIKNEPVEFSDDFQGYMRIQNVRQLVQNSFQPGAYEQIAAELHLLFVCLARKLNSVCDNASVNNQTLDKKRLAILEDYFNIGIQDPNCCKTQLASLLGVSERQLTRILQQTYHRTFSELLLSARMQIAHANIIENRATLESIAEAVGYPSVDALKRAYRAYFGKSIKSLMRELSFQTNNENPSAARPKKETAK